MAAAITLHNPALLLRVMWGRVWWFVGVHVLGMVAAPLYLMFVHLSAATPWMAAALFLLCHLSITVEVHRRACHKAYEASAPWRWFWIILFSGTLQNSAIWWATMHRRHHNYEDTELDPYTVKHGLWWAHMLWLLRDSDAFFDQHSFAKTQDLTTDSVLRFQERHKHALGILVGLVLPTTLGALWGDVLGGLLVGGFARLVVQYHTTWSINSVAHCMGPWRYSPRKTARVCYWVLAFTVGEWNHQGHHLYPNDYRLGNCRWYDVDPGKLVIWACSKLGLTWHLVRSPQQH